MHMFIHLLFMNALPVWVDVMELTVCVSSSVRCHSQSSTFYYYSWLLNVVRHPPIMFTLNLTVTDSQLEVRACCVTEGKEDKCETYRKAEDILGVGCCRDVPYNTFTHLCCGGVVRMRERGERGG